MRHKTFLIVKLLWGILNRAGIEKAAERSSLTQLVGIFSFEGGRSVAEIHQNRSYYTSIISMDFLPVKRSPRRFADFSV